MEIHPELYTNKDSLSDVFFKQQERCGVFCVLTNIEGDVIGFNNPETQALVQELPLCENQHKELHVSSTLLLTLHMNTSTDRT